jgi:16S rRNA (guanine527-N7)-methyltransferase
VSRSSADDEEVAQLRSRLETAQTAAHLIEPLARYGALVLEANRRFNLTGAKNADDMAPHIVDSLTLLPYVREPFIDIGSGAGLPAIPLAVAAGVHVTLIESTRKKARFLEHALARLDLRGEVVPLRAEVAAHDQRWREHFASGTARAVALAPAVAELLLPFLAVGGIAILQRGMMDNRERAALEDAATVLGGIVEAEHRAGGERRIVLLRKTLRTPARFPRRTGTPQKRPLAY